MVFDPFVGSGTTAVVSIELGRNYLGFEINPFYCEVSKKRIDSVKNYDENEMTQGCYGTEHQKSLKEWIRMFVNDDLPF